MNTEEQLHVAEAALREIAKKQQETLEMIRSNGFVFDSIGKEQGNWQHLAFSIYTDICEIDVAARSALVAMELIDEMFPEGKPPLGYQPPLGT